MGTSIEIPVSLLDFGSSTIFTFGGASNKMQNFFFVVLFALVLTLTHVSPLDFDIHERATSSRYCVGKDVNLLKKVVKYPIYFCKFWQEE